MREDITWMISMPDGGRYIRVFPNHWQWGHYEVITDTGSADIILHIRNDGWQERNKRIIERGIWSPPPRKLRIA
jgi:hypothetical protein